jgi:hypothetical protein
VKSRDLNIELLTISTGNIWKLCGLELNDILIQQQLIFTEKDQSSITERVRAFVLKDLLVNIDKPVVYSLIRNCNSILLSIFFYLIIV